MRAKAEELLKKASEEFEKFSAMVYEKNKEEEEF